MGTTALSALLTVQMPMVWCPKAKRQSELHEKGLFGTQPTDCLHCIRYQDLLFLSKILRTETGTGTEHWKLEVAQKKQKSCARFMHNAV